MYNEFNNADVCAYKMIVDERLNMRNFSVVCMYSQFESDKRKEFFENLNMAKENIF